MKKEKEYTIGWEQKCTGCGHHDSMWKSLTTSKEWNAWYKYQTGDNQHYDVDECQELGIMSAGHWEDFIKFCKSNNI